MALVIGIGGVHPIAISTTPGYSKKNNNAIFEGILKAITNTITAKPSQAKPNAGLIFAFVCASASAQQSINPDWTAVNRYVEIGVGRRQQNYQENDLFGLTANGILDSESGLQRAIQVGLRWQADWGGFAALQGHRQTGATSYRGYLQSGIDVLTPYASTTGNVASHAGIQLGYVLNARTWGAVSERWQIVPVASHGWHTWERNLAQYTENYAFQSQAIGAIVQWQPRIGTILEAQALSGRTQSASVSALTLGFDAHQPGGTWRQWQLDVSQDLAAATGYTALHGWRVFARHTHTHTSHAASAVVNGLQAPSNVSSSSQWLLGVKKQF